MRTFSAAKLALLASVILTAACTRQVSFKHDILPIFQERCMKCHATGSPGCVTSGFTWSRMPA